MSIQLLRIVTPCRGIKLSCTINTLLRHAYAACTDHVDGSDNVPVPVPNKMLLSIVIELKEKKDMIRTKYQSGEY